MTDSKKDQCKELENRITQKKEQIERLQGSIRKAQEYISRQENRISDKRTEVYKLEEKRDKSVLKAVAEKINRTKRYLPNDWGHKLWRNVLDIGLRREKTLWTFVDLIEDKGKKVKTVKWMKTLMPRFYSVEKERYEKNLNEIMEYAKTEEEEEKATEERTEMKKLQPPPTYNINSMVVNDIHENKTVRQANGF